MDQAEIARVVRAYGGASRFCREARIDRATLYRWLHKGSTPSRLALERIEWMRQQLSLDPSTAHSLSST